MKKGGIAPALMELIVTKTDRRYGTKNNIDSIALVLDEVTMAYNHPNSITDITNIYPNSVTNNQSFYPNFVTTRGKIKFIHSQNKVISVCFGCG